MGSIVAAWQGRYCTGYGETVEVFLTWDRGRNDEWDVPVCYWENLWGGLSTIPVLCRAIQGEDHAKRMYRRH
jgi:hypothetical protein